MKYKVSELMERAKSILDIDNSKVISYDNEMRYLDQAWRGTAQKLINQGIKYFHSQIIVHTGINPLPNNFYQVDCICTRDGYCLPRFSNGMSEHEPSYDIVGNSLLIRSGVGIALTLKYYSKPMWLTFPAPSIQINEIPVSSNVHAYYDTSYIYLTSSTEVHKYDIRTGTDELVYIYRPEDPTDIITALFAGKGNIYIVTSTASIIVSYTGKELTKQQGYYPLYVDENDMLYLSEFSNEADELIVYNHWQGSTKIRPISNISSSVKADTDTIYSYRDKMIGHIKNESFVVDITTGETLRFGTNSRLARCIFEDTPALVCEDTINWYRGNWFQTGIDTANEVISVLKADTKTGYGLLTSDGTNTYVESFMPDTILDFPSTLLYDYVAYSIAYLYATKLGIDTSFIRQAIEVTEEQFYDSLDANSGHKTVAIIAPSGNFV